MTFKLATWVLLGLTASLAAYAGPTHDGIVGGEEVSADDPVATSTVLIIGKGVKNTGKTYQYICSGSLIASDIVVTAGHCVADYPSPPVNPADLRIIFSTHKPTSATDPSIRKVSGYRANPGWTGKITKPDAHDIAVIRFEGSLPEGYAPATLLDSDTALSKGEDVLLAGYGITSADDQTGESAGDLRKVEVKVAGTLGKTEVVVDETDGAGSCSGDSGGPAFVEDSSGQVYLWGATSRGDKNCAVEGIYTRISAYSDFIEKAEKELRGE